MAVFDLKRLFPLADGRIRTRMQPDHILPSFSNCRIPGLQTDAANERLRL